MSTATSSSTVCALVQRGDITADEAVDLLCDAGDHGGRRDCSVACPECGCPFWRGLPVGRWNTCSDACQRAWNMAIFDLDAGRTIVKISELSAERASELLTGSGLMLDVGARKVLLS